jgi:hypothetical protein
MLHSYFDAKKDEIEKSKIGFRGVLESMPKASKKYPVRSVIENRKDNDEKV